MIKLLPLLGVLWFSGARAEVVCGTNQYLPNPDSCSSYYECSNGLPYLMPCPTGEDFSPTLLVCTDPEEANCGTLVTVATTSSAITIPIATGPTSSHFPQYYCPPVDGSSAYLYPNPLSCSSFYMCNGGKLQIIQCPQGLEYSVTERVCLYSYAAKCDLSNLPTFPNGPTTPATCQATTTTFAPAGPTPNYYCPEVDGATSYIYANPYSCSSYYMCAAGKLYQFQCPVGLEFSITERVCTFADFAKCELNHIPSYPTGPTEAPGVSNPTAAPTTEPLPIYYCPEVDSLVNYIYPSPHSCSSYYMCAGGTLHLFQCPSGLQYSVSNRVCVSPALAKCDLNNLPSYPTGPTEAPGVSNPTGVVSTRPTPSYYCPEVDGANTYIYASPFSCSSYYMCAEGKLYLFQCPGGLEFSVSDRVCAFPYVAKCDLNHLPSYPTGPTEAITAATPTTTVTPGPVPNYYCPNDDSSQTYLYPNPYSCASYYMCVEGILYIVQCQSGLEYSIEFRVCLIPSIAKCDLNNLPTYPTAATVNPSISVTPIPSYYCPEVDTITPYMYPNPYSCSSYYQCIKGKLRLYLCPEGFEYSVTERICVSPSIAKCDLTNLPAFPTGPTASPAVPTEITITDINSNTNTPVATTASSDVIVTITYECPPDESGTYYRYPGNCHKFVECNYGVAEIQDCPAGLLFSESQVQCLYPQDVPECSVTTSQN
ncbi:hypothetical protein PR048_022556 [Dryococelus australis]|uniref:Chitin-binding type-2 domain-containing protein n=1 Tax=Dryococelus australis TaxID=614101 RepID=A0ABQ9H1E5_9NEOP|nr:hypothetical protein PR048_022556 [Dryococelus australis]